MSNQYKSLKLHLFYPLLQRIYKEILSFLKVFAFKSWPTRQTKSQQIYKNNKKVLRKSLENFIKKKSRSSISMKEHQFFMSRVSNCYGSNVDIGRYLDMKFVNLFFL